LYIGAPTRRVGGEEFGQGRSAQFGFVLLRGVTQFSGGAGATRVATRSG
jgi:hypothetical protein